MPVKSSYSDRQVLYAVRHNGTAGWDLFCREFDPLIRSITEWSKWNFSDEEQQDVRQEVYVQMQTALKNFKQECSLRWFIKKIVIHQCINEVRRQVRWRTVMTSSVQQDTDGCWKEIDYKSNDALDPHQEVLKLERMEALNSALAELQSNCKKAITLFYVRNLSYREIAEKFGISVNTVGSRLSKCLDKLQHRLQRNPLFERTI